MVALILVHQNLNKHEMLRVDSQIPNSGLLEHPPLKSVKQDLQESCRAQWYKRVLAKSLQLRPLFHVHY